MIACIRGVMTTAGRRDLRAHQELVTLLDGAGRGWLREVLGVTMVAYLGETVAGEVSPVRHSL